jgi:hypothetical protein
MVPYSCLSEKFPRLLTFVTRCGCTKTRHEAAGSRCMPEIRVPLENRPRVEYLRGDLPSDVSIRTTYQHRDFVLENIRFDSFNLCYELIYREKER